MALARSSVVAAASLGLGRVSTLVMVQVLELLRRWPERLFASLSAFPPFSSGQSGITTAQISPAAVTECMVHATV